MGNMTAHRLPRGTRHDPVALGWEVERNVRDRLKAIASNMGVSAAVLVQLMDEHLELTDQGVPVWWEPLPRDDELAMPADEEGLLITGT